MVKEFHTVFEHPHPVVLDNNVLSNNKKLIQFRIDLIEEELRELKDAVRDDDLTEVVDALGDLEYVLNGMAIAIGVDLPKVTKLVHESNMTKLCKTEQEALDTIEYYKTLKGFENVTVGYRPSPAGFGFVVYNVSTSKVLKSMYFKLPDFSSILTNS